MARMVLNSWTLGPGHETIGRWLILEIFWFWDFFRYHNFKLKLMHGKLLCDVEFLLTVVFERLKYSFCLEKCFRWIEKSHCLGSDILGEDSYWAFVGIFKITLQLMRFQSQKLYQVKRLLSDVRKIKKGSWKSWCFKQLFLPSVVWDSYIFLTSENNKKVSTCNIFQKSSAYAITRGKKSSSLLLFDWPTVYKVIAHCLYSSCQSVSVFSSSV